MSLDAPPPARPHRWYILAAAGVSLVAAVLVALLATRLLTAGPAFRGTAWEPPEPAAEFRLTEHTGRPVRLSDFRGKAVLLFFGYANCPDVCPLTLDRLRRVLSGMGADTSEVRVLLVSVDPRRDTPAALASYVSRFSPWVTGLTGDSTALAAVRKSYYAYAEPAQAMPGATGAEHVGHVTPAGALTHTPQVFGIDPEGRIRVLLPMERPEEEIAADIRTLIRQ